MMFVTQMDSSCQICFAQYMEELYGYEMAVIINESINEFESHH